MKKLKYAGKFIFLNLIKDWPIKLITVLIFINGLLTMESVLIFHPRHYSAFFLTLMPFGLYSVSRTIAVVLGFALIYLSYNIYRRKLLAWWMAIIILSIIFAEHLMNFHPFYLSADPFLTLMLLLYYQKYFVVRYDKGNILEGVKIAVSIFFFAVIFGTAGFWFLDKRDFGIDFHLWESLIRTIREYFLIGNYDLVPRNYYALRFLELLRFTGFMTFVLVAYSIFKPLYRLKIYAHERELAKGIAEKWGNSSLDFFKLWPDKKIFFSDNFQSFIAFKINSGVAMALGEPVGPEKNKKNAAKQFLKYTRENGWIPAFYCVSEEFKMDCRDLDLRSLKIGFEALVNLEQFVTQIAQDKKFSRIVRKFEKNNQIFGFKNPPHSKNFLEEIKKISDDWLKVPGRKERNFAIGYFDEEYLSSCPIFYIKNSKGAITAFANQVKSYAENEATIDLMRYRRDTLNGTMDFLFIKIFYHFFNDGYRKFDLGLSPVSQEDMFSQQDLKGKYLQKIYKNASMFFSFQGMYEYKKKFEPIWEDRYLVYPNGPLNIAKVIFSLSKLSKVKKFQYE